MDKEKYCNCINTRSYRCSRCGLTQDDDYLEKRNVELALRAVELQAKVAELEKQLKEKG